MQSIDQPAFTLIKCQPDQILFIDRKTRLVYRYLDSPIVTSQRTDLQHSHILPGIPFQQGFLYLKEQSTLLTEIEQRARSHIKQQFLQEEIVNTFEPLFQCLYYLHENGVTHGSVHLESIVISNDQIKIRDWKAPTVLTCQYYPSQKQPIDDIKALGLCLLNCVLLTTQKPIIMQKEAILQQIINRYSKPFVLAVIVIVNQHIEHYGEILRLLKGKTNTKDSNLVEAYQRIRSQKEKKKKHQLESSSNLPATTLKKHTVGITKKVFHHENIQNKLDKQPKTMAEHGIKRKEKSALAYELIGKKLNQEETRLKEESVKRVTSKPVILNLSNFGVENNSKKLQRQRSSPFAKNRNCSRKK